MRSFLTDIALARSVAVIKVFHPFDALNACLHRACRDAQGRPFTFHQSPFTPLPRAPLRSSLGYNFPSASDSAPSPLELRQTSRRPIRLRSLASNYPRTSVFIRGSSVPICSQIKRLGILRLIPSYFRRHRVPQVRSQRDQDHSESIHGLSFSLVPLSILVPSPRNDGCFPECPGVPVSGNHAGQLWSFIYKQRELSL